MNTQKTLVAAAAAAILMPTAAFAAKINRAPSSDPAVAIQCFAQELKEISNDFDKRMDKLEDAVSKELQENKKLREDLAALLKELKASQKEAPKSGEFVEYEVKDGVSLNDIAKVFGGPQRRDQKGEQPAVRKRGQRPKTVHSTKVVLNCANQGSTPMTGKERMRKTLRFEEPDRPPHFEIMFELEKEAFGLSFPDRNTWAGMSPSEKDRAVGQCMEIYARILERYKWEALAVYWPWSDPDGVRAAKKLFGNDILIGSIVGQSILSIEGMTDWESFAISLVEDPDSLHLEAKRRMDCAMKSIERLVDAGADFVHLVNDVAFNQGPFISPAQFAELITPYLEKQVRRIQELGAYAFVHSDGNIMPVLDQYLATGANLFQSVDPMAGMDIAEVKLACHGKMALMGNVQCSLLQDGPEEEITKSALYCLEHGSPGGGYVFSTSNTIFQGMPLKNYEHMLKIYSGFCQKTC